QLMLARVQIRNHVQAFGIKWHEIHAHYTMKRITSYCLYCALLFLSRLYICLMTYPKILTVIQNRAETEDSGASVTTKLFKKHLHLRRERNLMVVNCHCTVRLAISCLIFTL